MRPSTAIASVSPSSAALNPNAAEFAPRTETVEEDTTTVAPPLAPLGMISHKKSLITIFGHKHKIKNFINKPENPFQTMTSQKIANIDKVAKVAKFAQVAKDST